MKNEIAKGLLNSLSYIEYRKTVSDLLKRGSVSGNEQSEDLLKYSFLNETRMNRLDKTLSVPEDVAGQLKNLKKEYIWLVLTEGWCGDAAQINPILFKMASVTDKIELRFVFRDENDGLMNCFLTNGSRSVPKVIVLEKSHNDLKANWGPRPEGASNLIKSYKKQYGVVDETAKTELQLWYLHDKGLSTMRELTNLMVHIEALGHQKI
jgi:hypothetical protein